VAVFKPSDFVKSMNPDSLRVHAPSTVVFLCGGAIDRSVADGVIDGSATPPKMLRDAFYRAFPTAAANFKIVLAEDAKPLTADAGYRDLFIFESDIAQIVGLIVLFAESAGSLAELGAFAALKTVAPSLLAVIDDYYYDQSSFIRNGPILFLEKAYGEEWVLVLDRKEVGIAGDGTIDRLNLSSFSTSVFSAINKRLAGRHVWAKLDVTNGGHAILLIIGLCQEFGALTLGEIKEYLTKFGIQEPRLDNFIYCAELLGWLKKVRKGHQIFYIGVPGEAAIDYKMNEGAAFRDKLRWRSDVLAHWQKHDPPRLRAIGGVVSPPASTP
jgi:hypothetical protein